MPHLPAFMVLSRTYDQSDTATFFFLGKKVLDRDISNTKTPKPTKLATSIGMNKTDDVGAENSVLSEVIRAVRSQFILKREIISIKK